MPYPVSVRNPTPRELAEVTQTARESTWGMRYPPRRPPPLPGWIRVRFYTHLYKIRHEMLPDMEGDVPLHPSGGLDTRRVCQLWNLEECTPVDPMRWTPVERSEPNWLSPLAVRLLSEQNKCIMFIEPSPTTITTTHKRSFREASLHLKTSLELFAYLSFSVTKTILCGSVLTVWHIYTSAVATVYVPTYFFLDKHTKIPMWTEDSWELTKSLWRKTARAAGKGSEKVGRMNRRVGQATGLGRLFGFIGTALRESGAFVKEEAQEFQQSLIQLELGAWIMLVALLAFVWCLVSSFGLGPLQNVGGMFGGGGSSSEDKMKMIAAELMQEPTMWARDMDLGMDIDGGLVSGISGFRVGAGAEVGAVGW